ncbi:uncharacterized protein FTJAE_7599 [Fusarium tjaetaba]|uniref:Uncharacterized protein n=1 Tax=Fusarium tjaetaba TaxID=1567544 RepID=A0A8H5VP85_9HYPO|nr:uncharacterized protein FTJAE_7599 [Fusarium tjaetaba]KAF5632267.1 hypothetical protein FTJAE_7599 [Fusarium tjaetaba]
MKPLTFLLIQACGLVSAQVVSPYPVSDCGGGIAGTELQCPDQPGCCSGGAMCCAGGCCPLSAVCVNSGTSNEQCCDLSDKSLCGAAVTDSVRFLSRIRIFYIRRVPVVCTRINIYYFQSPACPTAAGIHPSKLCVGVDSDWYCPWDAVCNNAGGGCIGGRAKRDNCDEQATETAAETAQETAAETESDSFTDDFATTTESSALSTVVDTSASHSKTKSSLAVPANNLPIVLLAAAFVLVAY